MIKFSLKCSQEHVFESWFQSGSAFDSLIRQRLLACPICGDCDVAKAIMAPRVRPSRRAAPEPADEGSADAGGVNMHALTVPASPAEAALRELRQKIQEHSEYVGRDFAAEARAIHEGDAPERSIYGEADGEEARQLIEDGIPVAPLPFTPTRKTN